MHLICHEVPAPHHPQLGQDTHQLSQLNILERLNDYLDESYAATTRSVGDASVDVVSEAMDKTPMVPHSINESKAHILNIQEIQLLPSYG